MLPMTLLPPPLLYALELYDEPEPLVVPELVAPLPPELAPPTPVVTPPPPPPPPQEKSRSVARQIAIVLIIIL